MLHLQAALGVAQEALEREKGGIKALQEQLQSGKVSCIQPEIFLGARHQPLVVGASECG